MATLIYSVPKSLAVQYLEPETHVRLHSCGFFFSFPSCISKEIPGCHEAFSQKQSYNGNFRHAWRPEDADPWGKGEAELWKGSRRECAEGAPLQGALFTAIRGRCCPWCRAGRAKEALLLPLCLGGGVPCSRPAPGPSPPVTKPYFKSSKVKCQWNRPRRKTHALPCLIHHACLDSSLVCNYLPLVSLKAPAPPGVLVPHLLDREIIPALPFVVWKQYSHPLPEGLSSHNPEIPGHTG